MNINVAMYLSNLNKHKIITKSAKTNSVSNMYRFKNKKQFSN